MLQIFPANALILSVLGKQPFTRDDSYRLSFFCLCESVKEGTLLFNNLTKELIIVESPLSALKESEYAELVERWFFVNDSFDEVKISDEISDVLRFPLQHCNNKSFTILPTTGCNARCFYCFEKGIHPQTMSEDTAIQVAKFITVNCKKSERISLRWFGGEPLLNTKAIDKICEYLSSETDLNYKSSIITNGYLLNEALINHAINSWNLQKVQITLDGTEATYNKVKSFIYPDCNAYQTVLNNILSLSLHDLQISIRLNVDEYNLDDMKSLVSFLSDLLPCKKHICINIAPLFERAGATKLLRTEEQRQSLLHKITLLTHYITSLGFSRPLHLSKWFLANSCAADNKNAVVIMPNGNLLRCEHMVEKNTHGNVFTENSMSEGIWTRYYSPLPICKDCPLYPSCHRLEGCVEKEYCSSAIKEYRISGLKECMLAEYNRYIDTN